MTDLESDEAGQTVDQSQSAFSASSKRKYTKKCTRCRTDKKRCDWLPEKCKCQRCYDIKKPCTGQVEPPPKLRRTSNNRPMLSPTSSSHRHTTRNPGPENSTPNSVVNISFASGQSTDDNAWRHDDCVWEELWTAILNIVSQSRDECKQHLRRINPALGTPGYSLTLIEDLQAHDEEDHDSFQYITQAMNVVDTLDHVLKQMCRIRQQRRSRRRQQIHAQPLSPTVWLTNSNPNSTGAGTCHPALLEIVLQCTSGIGSEVYIGPSTWQNYLTVADEMNKFIVQEGLNLGRNGFTLSEVSPLHLAYLNNDITAMNALWNHIPALRKGKDLVGREIIHLLIEHGKTDLLEQLELQAKHSTAETERDARGMCPLSIAASLGMSVAFAFLRDRGAILHTGRHLLNFALIGNHVLILERVVQWPVPLVNQSYAMELRKAIELGRPNLVHCLLDCRAQAALLGDDERDKLADEAESKDDVMKQVAARLRQRTKINEAEEASKSLEQTNAYLQNRMLYNTVPNVNHHFSGPIASTWAQVVRGYPAPVSPPLPYANPRPAQTQSTDICPWHGYQSTGLNSSHQSQGYQQSNRPRRNIAERSDTQDAFNENRQWQTNVGRHT